MITADQFDRELDFLVTIALVEGFLMLLKLFKDFKLFFLDAVNPS